MNKTKKIYIRLISFLLALFIIFTGLGQIYAKKLFKTPENNKVSGKFFNNIIEKEFEDAFNKTDYVEYIITMKKKPEIKNDSKSHEVVQKLLDTALEDQEDIIGAIKKEVKNGNIKNYQSFFIVNSIFIVGNKNSFQLLSKRNDVEKVVLNKKINIEQNYTKNNFEGKYFKRDYVENNDISKKHIPWNLKSISVHKTFSEGYKGKGIVVGIIDSGVDVNHPALKSSYRGNDEDKKYYSFFDATTGIKGGEPTDATGHGTHVAGTILGNDPKGNSLLGIAPEAKWIAAKVFDKDGETTPKQLLDAGQWMLAPTDKFGNAHPEMAPKIINASWGGNSEDEFFRAILQAWRKAGILPVFSAGNANAFNEGGDGSIGTPASYPEAFSVGAIRMDDKVAKFSLRGPSKYADGFKPDIVAPGVNIKSSIKGNKYEIRTGTSMASPHVTGVATLIYSIKNDFKPEEVEKILRESATALTDDDYVSSPNHGYGYGKVNAYKAVKMAEKIKKDERYKFSKLKGKIIVKGKDINDVKINHTPMKTMYKGRPFDIIAKVSDDTYVKGVKLYINKKGKWEIKDFSLYNGNKKEGKYSVKILPEFLDTEKIKYYIEAIDGEGKLTKTPEYTVEVKDGISIGYKQNFEENLDGIEYGGKTPFWDWGNVKDEVNKTVKAKSKVLSTGLDGNYKRLNNPVFVLPTVDLTKELEKQAALKFKHFYDLDNGEYAFYDTVEVWIGEVPKNLTDNEKIDYKRIKSYTNSSKKWIEEHIDLSSYKGKKISIMFGLRIGEYSKKNKLGWFIDDIEIVESLIETPSYPTQDISLDYRNQRIIFNFKAVSNNKITRYNLYRSGLKDGKFEKVSYFDISESKNYITLTDNPKIKKGTYYYYVTSSIGEKESLPSKVFSHTFTEGKEIFSYDFEKDDQGWISKSDKGIKWTRGKIDEKELSENEVGKRPTPSQTKGKNEGSPNVWGTELNDFRKENSEYILESPIMDLSKLKKARLYLQMWFNTSGKSGSDDYGKYNNDIGYIKISKDNGNKWHNLFELKEENIDKKNIHGVNRNKSNWFTDGFDIPKEYLTDNVKIQFVLKTNSDMNDNNSGGWYIDDVSINDISPVNIEQNKDIIYNLNNLSVENVKESNKDTNQISFGESATIMIEETGVYVNSEKGSGEYEIIHPEGEYTLVVKAKGYKTHREKVLFKEGLDQEKDILLNKAEKFLLNLSVKDDKGKKIENPVIQIYDEYRFEPIQKYISNSINNVAIEEGLYKILVTAKGYKSELDREVFIRGNLNRDFVLKKIKLNESYEKYYDDGTAEKGLLNIKPDQKVAARFVVNKLSQINSVKLMFKSNNNKSIGKIFNISVYGKNNIDLLPGRVLLKNFDVKVDKVEEWQEVILPESIQVDDEFFVAYSQKDDTSNGPVLGIDEDTKGLGNYYKMINNAWNEPSEVGSYMIRVNLSEIDSDKDLNNNTIKKMIKEDFNKGKDDNIIQILKNDNFSQKINNYNVGENPKTSDDFILYFPVLIIVLGLFGIKSIKNIKENL